MRVTEQGYPDVDVGAQMQDQRCGVTLGIVDMLHRRTVWEGVTLETLDMLP